MTDIKCQKDYSRVQAKFALQPPFAEKPWGRAQPQLFAIEEEIAVKMPKNIARIAKIQLDE